MKIAIVSAGGQQTGRRRLKFASSTPTVTRTRSARVGTTALSPTQARILDVIRHFRKTRAVSPTYSEMRTLLGMRKNSQITPLLQALAERSWLRILPGVERGCVPLREGTPLYDADALRPTVSSKALEDEQPAEPAWIDCPALWESCLGEVPDLCLQMGCEAGEKGYIVALARRRDAAGNATVGDGDRLAARIGEDIVLATARVIDENGVELRWESGEGEARTMRMSEESDAAEIVGIVIGRLLPGAG